jgi:transcriptional regulatory protein RtcR
MGSGAPLHVVSIVGDADDTGADRRLTARGPNLALCASLRPARLELLAHPRRASVARRIVHDAAMLAPETRVEVFVLPDHDEWAVADASAALAAFAAQRYRRPEDLIVHLGTGTPVQTTCLTLLVQAGALRGRFAVRQPRGPTPLLVFDLEAALQEARAAHDEVAIQDARGFLKRGIATRNPAYERLIARLERVAVTSCRPILLLGPTGAGKSELARRIHDLRVGIGLISGRFEALNCATLRGQHAIPDLFGHGRGAFTGADRARDGLLLRADGGTVFLDEIGELGPQEQGMLLAAVEDKRFRPLGADDEVYSDFLLVCGTNRDLFARVDLGQFREDLLARIKMWTFELPGLKERPEDLEPNIDYELRRCGDVLGRPVTFAPDARAAYVAFALSPEATWRGNFRDLAASVERMATLAPGARISARDVAEETDALRREWGLGPKPPPAAPPAPVWPPPLPRARALLGERIARFDLHDLLELEAVLAACAVTRNYSEAGRLLFGVSRTQRKSQNDTQRVATILKRFGLGKQDVWPSAVRGADGAAQGDAGEGDSAAGAAPGSADASEPEPRP